jgi:hypothetical protein
MKLLSVQLARTVIFMDVGEVNQNGRDVFLDLFPALTQAYNFTASPKRGDDFKDGMKFTGGSFVNSKLRTVLVSLTVWNDGVGVDTYSSTTDSDEFAEQVFAMLPDLGYTYDQSIIRRRAHLSQLFVRTPKKLSTINPKLAAFAQRLREEAGAQGKPTFDLAAIEFWPDQTLNRKPGNFSFQKRTGDGWDEDRYWSQAGVATDRHLELLNEFEAMLD